MPKKSCLLNLLWISLSLCIFVSCGENNESVKKEEMKDNVTPPDTSLQTLPEENISYTLPSSMQIASIFKKSGLKYVDGITNPTDNLNKYNTGSTIVKALNLGIYSADLSYCMLNKQSQQSKNYFKACRQLGSDIGLSKAFEDNNVAQRIEKNMNREDSVTRILAGIQMETDDLLEDNKQAYLAVVSFTGAWIESIYIGMQVQAKEKSADIAAKLVEQMSIAENIVKALKAHVSKESEIKVLIDEMNSLNEIYTNFKSIKEIKATDPDIIDPAKVTISAEELQLFTAKVNEIRARFIKG